MSGAGNSGRPQYGFEKTTSRKFRKRSSPRFSVNSWTADAMRKEVKNGLFRFPAHWLDIRFGQTGNVVAVGLDFQIVGNLQGQDIVVQ